MVVLNLKKKNEKFEFLEEFCWGRMEVNRLIEENNWLKCKTVLNYRKTSSLLF